MASLVLRLKSKPHKRIGRVWIAFFYKFKDDKFKAAARGWRHQRVVWRRGRR